MHVRVQPSERLADHLVAGALGDEIVKRCVTQPERAVGHMSVTLDQLRHFLQHPS